METPTSVTLRRGEKAEDTILPPQIEEMRATSKSLMPEEFEKPIRQEAGGGFDRISVDRGEVIETLNGSRRGPKLPANWYSSNVISIRLPPNSTPVIWPIP